MTFWTRERTQEAVRMFKVEKLSYGLIADALGCSRSQIGGKLTRLGLYREGYSSVETKKQLRPGRKRRIAPGTPDIEPLGTLNEHPGAGHCQHITGDPALGAYRFCAREVSQDHKSWCDHHLNVVFASGPTWGNEN